MSDKSNIEWCDNTWNPIIGCSKISEGCKNCYAEKMAFRLSFIKGTFDYNLVLKNEYETNSTAYGDKINSWNGATVLRRNILVKPQQWKKPCKIFVCSMGDLFHESVPFEWINAIFTIMSDCDHHIYQILTKRPQRVLDFYSWKWEEIRKNLSIDGDYIPWRPKDNVWFGTTVESSLYIDRIELLLKIPAKIHFISCEPLLSNIDFNSIAFNKFKHWLTHNETQYPLDWVIAGPETGPSKRPMKKEWIESLYNQCKDANVPFFDKKDVLGLNIKEFPV